jgi:hypothetical protein
MNESPKHNVNKKAKCKRVYTRVVGRAQMVEHLPSKCKTRSSNTKKTQQNEYILSDPIGIKFKIRQK